MDITNSKYIEDAEMAYHFLLLGLTVHESPDIINGRVDTQMKRVKNAHPCLDIDYECAPDGSHHYCLSKEQFNTLALASFYYQGETLPKDYEHNFVMKGLHIQGVTRDSFHITKPMKAGDTLDSLLLDIKTEAAEFKIYPYIVGLDIYYEDGHHTSLFMEPINGEQIKTQINDIQYGTYKDKFVWVSRGKRKEIEIEGIVKVRALMFGKLLMM